MDRETSRYEYNPDQIFSALPQPYRMISKIIEFEILDAAWLELLRRNPDFHDQPLPPKRNDDLLNKICNPSSTAEVHTSPIVARVASGDLIFSIDSLSVFRAFNSKIDKPVGSYDGSVDYDKDWTASSLPWIPIVTDTIAVTASILMYTERLEPLAGNNKKSAAAVAVEALTKIHKRLKVFIFHVGDRAEQSTPTVAAEAEGVALPQQAASVSLVGIICLPLEEQENETSVTVDICSSHGLLSVSTRFGGCNVYDIPSRSSRCQQNRQSEHPAAASSAPLSPRKSVVGGTAKGGKAAAVVAGPPPPSPAPLGVSYVEPRVTLSVSEFFNGKSLQGAAFGYVSLLPPALPQSVPLPAILTTNISPTAVASSSSRQGPAAGNKVKGGPGKAANFSASDASASSSGLLDSEQSDTLTDADYEAIIQNSSLLYDPSVEIVVVFDEDPSWTLVELLRGNDKSNSENHSSGGPTDTSPTGPASTKSLKPASKASSAAAVAAANQSVSEFRCTVMGQWRLSARVTAYRVEQTGCFLLLGLADGSVILWDLKGKQYLSHIYRHPAPVSSLCFCPKFDVGLGPPVAPLTLWYNALAFSVMSGASDGTLCFYVFGDEAISSSAPLVESSEQYFKISKIGCLSFRTDLDGLFIKTRASKETSEEEFDSIFLRPHTAVLRISSLPASPLAVVEYGNGLVAVYDSQTAALLCQLSPTRRIRKDEPHPRDAYRWDLLKRALDSLLPAPSAPETAAVVESAPAVTTKQARPVSPRPLIADVPVMPSTIFRPVLAEFDALPASKRNVRAIDLVSCCDRTKGFGSLLPLASCEGSDGNGFTEGWFSFDTIIQKAYPSLHAATQQQLPDIQEAAQRLVPIEGGPGCGALLVLRRLSVAERRLAKANERTDFCLPIDRLRRALGVSPALLAPAPGLGDGRARSGSRAVSKRGSLNVGGASLMTHSSAMSMAARRVSDSREVSLAGGSQVTPNHPGTGRGVEKSVHKIAEDESLVFAGSTSSRKGSTTTRSIDIRAGEEGSYDKNNYTSRSSNIQSLHSSRDRRSSAAIITKIQENGEDSTTIDPFDPFVIANRARASLPSSLDERRRQFLTNLESLTKSFGTAA